MAKHTINLFDLVVSMRTTGSPRKLPNTTITELNSVSIGHIRAARPDAAHKIPEGEFVALGDNWYQFQKYVRVLSPFQE